MSRYKKYMEYIGKSPETLKLGSKRFHEEVNVYGFAEPHLYFKFVGLWLHAYISVVEVDFESQLIFKHFNLDVVFGDNNKKCKSKLIEIPCEKYDQKELFNCLYTNPDVESLIYQEHDWFKKQKMIRKRKNAKK